MTPPSSKLAMLLAEAGVMAPLLEPQTPQVPAIPITIDQSEGIHGGWEGRSGRHGPEGLTIKHHAILDELIRNPAITMQELAGKFEVTAAWLSCIIHSDAFQMELLKVRSEIRVGLITKVTALADLSTEKLLAKLPHIESPELLLEIQKSSLKSLGYGVTKKLSILAPGGNVNFGNQTVAADSFQRARATLEDQRKNKAAALLAPSPPMIQEVIEVPAEEPSMEIPLHDKSPALDRPALQATSDTLGEDS